MTALCQPAQGTLLDIGGGSGALSLALLDAGLSRATIKQPHLLSRTHVDHPELAWALACSDVTRNFAGLTVEETAAVLGVSPRTIKREWAIANSWLFRELAGNR